MEERYLEDFLKKTRNYYLSNSDEADILEVENLLKKDFKVFHIQKITFEEDVARKDAFENVISTMRLDGVSFIYLILGNEKGVEFYFGVVKDLNDKHAERILDIDEIGEEILGPSILGNFKGSSIEYKGNQLNQIRNCIDGMKYYGVLEGVPGIIDENQSSDKTVQGVDRLIDVMLGDRFGISILASPLSFEEIEDIEDVLYEIHNDLAPLCKMSIQRSNSTGGSTSESQSTNGSRTLGFNKSESTSSNKSEGSNKSDGFSKSKGRDNSESETHQKGHSESTQKGESSTEGSSESETKGSSRSDSKSDTWSDGKTESIEQTKKRMGEWVTYLDDVVFKRLDYGKSKGLFHTSIFLFASSRTTLYKLGNTMQALFSGTNGNKVPLLMREISNKDMIQSMMNFQHPKLKLDITDNREKKVRVVLSQNIPKRGKGVLFGNWMSTNELSLIAGLPQKEVVGLQLKEEIEFGLNSGVVTTSKDDQLNLGWLVRSGDILKIPVSINKSNLDKHTFITGVTGSGKTTTCLKILLGSELPFLVIEPAKTEYRVLKNAFEDLLIFTLGDDNVAPFRLNPFEFFPHENITSRVDLIKASIEAAFDMEAAIPQIIEASLYKCYEEYGWNISNNKNKYYEDPFAEGVYSFPTLSDLIRNVTVVSEEQGFDDRLKNDYIGSIKARLQGLLVGSKGLMLNTKRSVDFKNLVEKQVVLELDEVKNGNEKSLIMGFVLANLNEAVKAKHYEAIEEGKKFRHITLVEEAHRLLTKFQPGDNPSKRQGVEVFADMLAEVRKYGEALIIVDQIPNKLTPEVLKNTNTKIIHKLFARDDKDAIGDTIALSDEQKDFLSNLSVGRTIVNSQDFDKPLQVQIEENKELSTTLSKPIKVRTLKESSLNYYRKNYKMGILKGLQCFESKPSIGDVENILHMNQEGDLDLYLVAGLNKKTDIDKLRNCLKDLHWSKSFTEEYIKRTFFNPWNFDEKSIEALKVFLNFIYEEGDKPSASQWARICV